MVAKKKKFGFYQGKDVFCYHLENENKFAVECISYGAVLKAVYYPDGEAFEQKNSVVLGYEDLESYLDDSYCLGASIGRVAGRIGGARFQIGDKEYHVEANENAHLLHGGNGGFSRIVWDSVLIEEKDVVGVRFFTHIKGADDGFPGNLDACVTYLLDNENRVRILFEAKSDAATLFNPTNHAYFNLSGNAQENICNHKLLLPADSYLELDDQNIPTGKRLPVSGTSYDFRKGQMLGDSLEGLTQNFCISNAGLDTPFCLDTNKPSPTLSLIQLSHAKTGRSLTVRTAENAVVVYTANHVDSSKVINGVAGYPYMGIALEAQTLPGAVHHEGFGDIVLLPNEEKRTEIVFAFA